MKELTHLSLFSGIVGLYIAAEMAGFRTVGQCEWADYPTKVLEKHWPDVPRWRDQDGCWRCKSRRNCNQCKAARRDAGEMGRRKQRKQTREMERRLHDGR